MSVLKLLDRHMADFTIFGCLLLGSVAGADGHWDKGTFFIAVGILWQIRHVGIKTKEPPHA